MITVDAPKNSIVSAEWPVAVTGFLMPFEKIMNSIFEMWSKIMPEKAIACAFNLEYLLCGGNDARSDDKPIFMFYEWLPGGWGGRNGKDGSDVTTACFGTGLMSQPIEGNERVVRYRPTVFKLNGLSWTREMAWRQVVKSHPLCWLQKMQLCRIFDRERAVVWGIEGGLPSMPHGLTIKHNNSEKKIG